MRHQNKTVKLGRSQAHRDALLANQAISLITESRIKTTLAKAKAVRPFAEKLVTLGKKNTLHSRRTALSILRHNEEAVRVLFSEIAPRCLSRRGGYIRIVKLGNRNSDAAPMAFLEWVDAPAGEPVEAKPTAKATKTKKAAATTTEEAAAPKKAAKKKTEATAEAGAEEAAVPAAEGEATKPARKAKAKKADAPAAE
jgi:large subunit ribosomal protein L17